MQEDLQGKFTEFVILCLPFLHTLVGAIKIFAAQRCTAIAQAFLNTWQPQVVRPALLLTEALVTFYFAIFRAWVYSLNHPVIDGALRAEIETAHKDLMQHGVRDLNIAFVHSLHYFFFLFRPREFKPVLFGFLTTLFLNDAPWNQSALI
jgi:hypothetical protein